MSIFCKWMLRRLGIKQTHAVTIRRNIKVPMPDGAELLTDLYLGDPSGRAPVILVRSPYGKSTTLAAGSAYPLAARGFNVVMQSCRGTFGSTGVFDPHHDEQRDGLATLEWIKQQPWYAGVIGTYGMSYLGYTQWAVAAPAGPELKAMAMQVTLSDFSRMTYSGDAFMLENAFSWTHMVTGMKNGGLFFLRYLLASLFGRSMIRPAQWQTLPLGSMDGDIIGERVGFWQDWVEHASSRDPWWQPMNHHRDIGNVQRPITLVAGWHDIFLPWQLQDFVALRAAGCPARITIGPWRHTDEGLGRASLRDAFDWFDHYLRGEGPAPSRPAVRLFVAGADEWREFDAWPPPDAQVERWYLQPDRGLAREPAVTSGVESYDYDPADPTPSLGGPALAVRPFAPDNAPLEARADVLVFTASPLASDVDLVGPVSAELYVSSTAASADFFVRLCDVDTAGVSRNICDGLQRLPITPGGGPQQVTVALWPTAYRLRAGHRLRLQVSSGAFPRWARNPGTGEALATARDLRQARQSVYFGAEQPSAIAVSVIPHG